MNTWQEEALCAQVDYELFFPKKGEPTITAKDICRNCAVREQCLEYALTNREKHGIWGGTAPRERRRLWEKSMGLEQTRKTTSNEKGQS